MCKFLSVVGATADSENDCCLMDLIPDPVDYAEQLEDQDYEAWKTATVRQEVLFPPVSSEASLRRSGSEVR